MEIHWPESISRQSGWLRRPGAAASCLILFCLAHLICERCAARGALPDPVALLRGVENARVSVRSGRLEMTIVQNYPQLPRRGRDTIHLDASFDGINRRYDQRQRTLVINGSGERDADAKFKRLRSMGEDYEAFVAAGLGRWRDTHVRSAYDGVQFMQYAEEMGSHVMDPSKGTAEFVFDPRTLGITVYSRIDDTVANFLAYRDAKSVTLEGEERVDGHPTWHVHVIDKYDQSKNFWIEDAQGFPVRRSTFEFAGARVVVTSEYEDSRAGSPLPIKVRNEQFDRDQKLWMETTITVDKSRYGVPVDPKLWTLAGLDMPLGQMVIDDRINRVIGHFDGEAVSPNLPEALRKGREARRWPLNWFIGVSVLVLGSAIAALIVRRYNVLREEK